jgi:hypothetical protein
MRWYVTGRGSYENPWENKVGGIYSGDQLCYGLKVSATTTKFFFAKEEWPEKTRNVLYNISLLSSAPGTALALGPGRA